MAVDHSTLLFFDAACLVVAANRPNGGAGFLLQLCHRQMLRAAVSPSVMREAEDNLKAKFPVEVGERFYEWVSASPFIVAPIPSESEVTVNDGIINWKDAHVVTSALNVGAPFLLTLDRPLIRELAQSGLAVLGITPGDFIKHHLPTHPEIAHLRD